MRKARCYVFLAVLPALVAVDSQAADFYVSPTGTTGTRPGTGTISTPWALQTALSQPPAVHPGDRIWIRGGTYTGNFTSRLKGTAKTPIVVRQHPGERATLDGNVNPAVRGNAKPVLAVHDGAFTWFWGFEVTNSNPDRTNPVSGSNPEDDRGDGISITAPGTKIINVVVHDTGQGIGCASVAKDVELYGNIIYFNGYKGPDRGHGHGLYVQNYEGGSKLIKHNILFDPFSYNLHAFGSRTAGFRNTRVEGNVWRGGPSLVGGEPGFDIGGTLVTGNFSWSASLNMGFSTTRCADVTVSENYLTNIEGAVFSPGRSGCRKGETITGNTLVGDLSGFVPGDYPGNTFYSKVNPPTLDKVAILPNEYEAGRAMIVIYNWDRSATQAVDLTGVVSPGAAYEIRNAQNFYGPAVVSRTFSKESVTLPMSGLTAATPVGSASPAPIGPIFYVFVVLSTRSTTR